MSDIEVEDAPPQLAGPPDGPRDRRPSNASSMNRERPAGGQPVAKRPRVWAGEDKMRGQRLMGNLLGTLTKFKGEETSRAATAKARKRDEVANKVANKIRSENERMHEVHALEREKKACRIEIDRREFEMKTKELTVRTRSQQLPGLSHFLLTTSTWVAESTADRLPLSLPPAMDKVAASRPKPLFYKPKILLPEQESLVREQIETTRRIIEEEESSLAELKQATSRAIKELHARLNDANQKLVDIDGNAGAEKLAASMEDTPKAVPSVEPEVVASTQPEVENAEMEVDEEEGKPNDEEVEY